MPRRARLVPEHLPLHLIQRGNNRQTCFHRDADYIAYLSWLDEYARTSGCAVHAYVLMSNHVHILASFTAVEGPALLMKGLSQQYSQYFNWWYGRSGTVWEGRYRSSPVPDENYFLTCQRYIELNPVRAGMASTPEEYRWSSYRGNVGMRSDSLITAHQCYRSLGPTEPQQQAAYRTLFDDQLNPVVVEEIRRAAKTSAALGNPPGRRGRPPKA